MCVVEKPCKQPKAQVVIPGNSHLKGSVLRNGNYVSAKFEVSGLIKSGAGYEKLWERP